MPSSLGGLAEGLWGFVDNERRLSQDRENTAAQKEAALYSLLAEHGTEEFASMGLAGLAEMANPKRTAKGMRGFFGEMEKSQTLPRIRELMATPQVRQVETPGLPSRGIGQAQTMHAAPPGVQTGQPPPAPQGMQGVLPQSQVASGAAPPAPGDAFTEQRATPDVGRTDEVSGPRQVLVGNMERQLNDKRRALKAAGASDEEIQQALLADVGGRWGLGGRAGAAGNLREGNITPDAQSPTGFSQALYHPVTGQIVETIPALDPTQSRAGAANFSTAMNDTSMRLFGKPYGALQGDTKKLQQVYDQWRKDNPEAIGEAAGARETGKSQAAAVAPLSHAQRAVERGRLYDEWTKSSAALKTVQEQNASLKAGMEAARRGDLAAGAEAVRITFSKILDPNSVVMPGEFLRGNAALSLAQWVKGKMEQYKAGGIGVPLEELESYAQLAQEIELAYAKFMEGERSRVETVAREGGIDPAGIFGSAQTPTMQQGKPALPTTTPSTGTATTPAPTAAPVAAPAAAPAKPTTMYAVRQWMARTGLSESAAIADIERRGFTITDKGQ